MKFALFILICIFSCTCCQKSVEKDPWNGFRSSDLMEAWRICDSSIVNKWIYSLSDTLDDYEFYGRIAELSRHTGFCYGNVDPTDSTFWNKSRVKRNITKTNIYKVYLLYSNSCLFMKNIDSEMMLSLQDNYWSDTSVFNSYQIDKIKVAIDSLCDKQNCR